MKIRVRVTLEFVPQLSLAVGDIGTGRDEVRLIRRRCDQREGSDPIQVRYLEPISATMEAISKPMRS